PTRRTRPDLLRPQRQPTPILTQLTERPPGRPRRQHVKQPRQQVGTLPAPDAGPKVVCLHAFRLRGPKVANPDAEPQGCSACAHWESKGGGSIRGPGCSAPAYRRTQRRRAYPGPSECSTRVPTPGRPEPRSEFEPLRGYS